MHCLPNVTLLFFVSILLATLSLSSCKAQKISEVQTVKSIPLPESLYFAGEKVPLDDPDVRERLEYELVANVYRHSRTLWILKSMGRWKEAMSAILCEEEVPVDFFYLAVAESELEPLVKSPVGALGMWQFMEGTAKEFDLEVSDHVDERKDPWLSAKAACRYLKKAHEIFGNWTSTAASYNRGISGLKKAHEEQKMDSYYDLYLNKETYRYVFRILALKIILENPDAYGFCIEPKEMLTPYAFKEVVIETSIKNLPDFAISYGISYKILKIYNPWLDSASYELPVKKGKAYVLRLPLNAVLKETNEKDKKDE